MGVKMMKIVEKLKLMSGMASLCLLGVSCATAPDPEPVYVNDFEKVEVAIFCTPTTPSESALAIGAVHKNFFGD